MIKRKKILIVDGYNIINAWDNLKKIMQEEGLEYSREKLNDIMSEYANFSGLFVIVVYDAYNVKETTTRVYDRKNMKIIYTKERQTADSYIEKFISEFGNRRYLEITVATDDFAERQIVIGKGGNRITTVQLRIEVENKQRKLKKSIETKEKEKLNQVRNLIQKDTLEKLKKITNKN